MAICIDCDKPAHPGMERCADCHDLACELWAEREYEDGETFRGGEAAAFERDEQARIQRELK